MTAYLRDLRLIPIALIASACLLVLKSADLVFDTVNIFAPAASTSGEGDFSPGRGSPEVRQPSQAPQSGSQSGPQSGSWAHQMFNFPGRGDPAGLPPLQSRAAPLNRRFDPDITGTVDAAKGETKGDAKKSEAGGEGKSENKSENKSGAKGEAGAKPGPVQPPPSPGGIIVPTDSRALPTGAERAILERLQQRREELDNRARELDIRENLVKGAEKRIDAQLSEMKEVEQRITVETKKKDDADAARFKSLVTMYENMKPRDAAKIFDHLEADVLLDVASQINPRQMAEILAEMSAESAERLTVELASRAKENSTAKPASTNDLPKIQGQPTKP